MSRSDGWMPLYVGAYLADTMGLNGAQHGAYLLLLMHYWTTGPLEDDDDTLAMIARTDPKVWCKEIGPKVRKFFELRDDGCLHQKRMDAERAKAADISEKRRAAAYASHQSTSGSGPPPSANAPASAPANAGAKGRANGVQQHSKSTCKPPASRADIRAGHLHLQNSKKEGSELRSDAAGAASRLPASPREQLWSEGLSLLRSLTGQSDRAARGAMGKLVRDAKDDCARVFNALWDASDMRPIDPMAWLTAAVKPKFRNGFLQLIADEGMPSVEEEPPDFNPVTAFLERCANGPH